MNSQSLQNLMWLRPARLTNQQRNGKGIDRSWLLVRAYPQTAQPASQPA